MAKPQQSIRWRRILLKDFERDGQLYHVRGPKLTGKSTQVERKRPFGEFQVDNDLLGVDHSHVESLHPRIMAVRNCVRRLLRRRKSPTAGRWFVTTHPDVEDILRFDEVIAIDLDARECKSRSRAGRDPHHLLGLIAKWYAKHLSDDGDEPPVRWSSREW
jgi:hypothetical protein